MQHNGDISLEHVALMAQANNENGGDNMEKCRNLGGQFCQYTHPDGSGCLSCCINNWRPVCSAFECKCEPPR